VGRNRAKSVAFSRNDAAVRTHHAAVERSRSQPRGFWRRPALHCTAPRLRQSLAALGSGYGLNEKPGYTVFFAELASTAGGLRAG